MTLLKLYIDKLTNNYYQITIGNNDYLNNIEKFLNLENILPDTKYLSNKSTHKLFNKMLIDGLNDVKGKYLSKFNSKYFTLYGLFDNKYVDMNGINKSNIIHFTKNFMVIFKEFSTNEDFEIKQLQIDSSDFIILNKNKIKIKNIININDINTTCDCVFDKYYYGINLFVKSDLDFNTIYKSIMHDITNLYVDGYYIIKEPNLKLKSKINFDDNFKGLLNINDVFMYADIDTDDDLKMDSYEETEEDEEDEEKDENEKDEDNDENKEKDETDLYKIKSNLENIIINDNNVKILEDIKHLCETKIEQYKSNIKNEIENNLKYANDIETLNKILTIFNEIYDE